MVKLFTAANLGEFRMTPLTTMSGRLNGVKCFLIHKGFQFYLAMVYGTKVYAEC